MGVLENEYYFKYRLRVAKQLREQHLVEDCISYIEQSAKYAWHNYSGTYTSYELETLLNGMSEEVLHLNTPILPTQERKILHICSEIYPSGGHTRLLLNWIKCDPESSHTFLTTRLTQKEAADIIVELQGSYDFDVHSVKKNTKVESAQALVEILKQGFDCVVLHIHPDETLANLVFSHPLIKIPVLFLNHADHVFWLGTTVIDKLVQIREGNIKIDADRRQIPEAQQIFLPIPISEKPINPPHSSTDKPLRLLSTGTHYKYEPNDQYNFLREALRIVETYDNVEFHIVGLFPDSDYAQAHQHPRIICHGIIAADALETLEEQTDIYVEGFPMASFTALLQVALRKVPVLLHYAPLPIFQLFANEQGSALTYPKDAEDWHQQLGHLILDKEARTQKTEAQFAFIKAYYSIGYWKKQVNTLYDELKSIPHQVKPMKRDTFYNGANEKILVTLDKWFVNHYHNTERLPLLRRLFIYKESFHKRRNVIYKLKKPLHYILGFYVNKN